MENVVFITLKFCNHKKNLKIFFLNFAISSQHTDIFFNNRRSTEYCHLRTNENYELYITNKTYFGKAQIKVTCLAFFFFNLPLV